ncbi:hypothetical protein, partial [Vreelandella rituensis]
TVTVSQDRAGRYFI